MTIAMILVMKILGFVLSFGMSFCSVGVAIKFYREKNYYAVVGGVWMLVVCVIAIHGILK